MTASDDERREERAWLLQYAVQIAAGLAAHPGPFTPEEIARDAFDIAEALADHCGLGIEGDAE